MPPHVVYRVDRFERAAEQVRERMRALERTAPIRYRRQNFGDYLIPAMTLRPELGEPEARGCALHVDTATAD